VSSQEITDIAANAKRASRGLAGLSSVKKTELLKHMAVSLRQKAEFLKKENAKDLDQAAKTGLSNAMIDRLTLSDNVIEGMARALEDIAEQVDPVGKITDMTRRPNGLMVGRMRIPIGVVAIIYESRPNVTSDAAGLCLKSGNAVILRGGSEAIHSNTAIIAVLKDSLTHLGVNPDVIGYWTCSSWKIISTLLSPGEGRGSSGRFHRIRSSLC
jgi:glutamate-5-semialdehyde dehydrogenase